MDEEVIKCSNCGYTFFELATDSIGLNTPCPQCQRSEKVILMDFVEGIEATEIINHKVKKEGLKKFSQEVISGDELFVAGNKMVLKERLIDRENDKYKELIIDKETGHVIHFCEESLKDHFGHGSAKYKQG